MSNDNNINTLKQYSLRFGDHIKVRRAFGLYSHHGIYIGNNNVLHLTGNPKRGLPSLSYGEGMASVQIDDLKQFENGGTSLIVERIMNKEKDFDKFLFLREVSDIVNKDKEYNLVTHNCEHFANTLTNKVPHSQQIQSAWYATTIGGVTSMIGVIALHTLTGAIVVPVFLASASFLGMQYW